MSYVSRRDFLKIAATIVGSVVVTKVVNCFFPYLLEGQGQNSSQGSDYNIAIPTEKSYVIHSLEPTEPYRLPTPTGTATPFQPQTYTPRTLPSYTPTQNQPPATITATQPSQLEIKVSLDEDAQSLHVKDDGVIDTNEQLILQWKPGYHTLSLNLPLLSNGTYRLQGDKGSYELVYNPETGNYELPASQKWNPWDLTNSQSDAQLKIVGPKGDLMRLLFSFQASKSTPTPGSSGNSDSGNEGNPGQPGEPTLPPPPPPPGPEG